jgi:Hydroxyacylglutathione hydrolase C-terminus
MYVRHKYTTGNLQFARSINPENVALVWLGELISQHAVTVSCMTISNEKEWNIFWNLTSEPVRYVKSLNLSLNPLSILSHCWLLWSLYRNAQSCYQDGTRYTTQHDNGQVENTEE